jgi:uncharacterized repeat protein (TIGR02543 family)
LVGECRIYFDKEKEEVGDMKKINVLLFISLFMLAFVGCSDIDIGYRTIDISDDDGVKTYTISFNALDGTPCSSQTAQSGKSITLPYTSCIGYTFNGWFSSSAGGTKAGDIGSQYTVTENTTLYAQWKPNGVAPSDYTISFNTQGGTSCDPKTAKIGESITLPSTSSSGYTFSGWFSSSVGGTKAGDIGGKYTVTGNTTLYAQWEPIIYTIKFVDPQGAAEWLLLMEQQSGNTIKLPAAKKDGYNFKGWSEADVGSVEYYAGDLYTVTDNNTLYAQW